MFDAYFCPRVVRRLQSNHDAEVLAGFLGYLDRLGHSRNTIHQYVRAAELLLRWLRRRKQPVSSIDEMTVHWFMCHSRSLRGSRHSTHAALRHLLRHLRATNRAASKAAAAKPTVERLVAEYDSHLDTVCGLAEATRLYRRRYARDFIQFAFGPQPMDWRRLKIGQVRDFIAQYGRTDRVAAAQVAAVSLRSSYVGCNFGGESKPALSHPYRIFDSGLGRPCRRSCRRINCVCSWRHSTDPALLVAGIMPWPYAWPTWVCG